MKHVCIIKTPPMEFTERLDGPPLFGMDISVMRGMTWPNGTVLRVSFMERTDQALKDKILYHMNAWFRRGANIKFVLSDDQPQIRITRDRNEGYWSYLGLDNLYVPRTEPTMALAGFSTRTADAEYLRVVRHETGHALGAPHEHSRKEIVAKLNRAKVIAYFKKWQGWSEQVIIDNILTPLDQRAIIGTRLPEQTSVMSYSFPGSLTNNGIAIPGGTNITDLDSKFMKSIYPMVTP